MGWQNDCRNMTIEPKFGLATQRRGGDGGGHGADRAEITSLMEHERLHRHVMPLTGAVGKTLPAALPRC